MIYPLKLHTAIFIFFAAIATIFSQTSDSTASVPIDTAASVSVTIEIPASASVTDSSSAKPLLISDSAMVETSVKDTNVNQGIIAIPSLKSLAFDTARRGALHIKVYPKNSSIFLNSHHVGDGNRTVENLQTGVYRLDLIHENDTLSDLIKIEHDKTTELDIAIGKIFQFSVETSFGIFKYNNNTNFGPTVDLGIQYRNNYFGIDYYWGFGEVCTFGGAAIKYRYAIHNGSIIKIAPEIAAGFWYASDYDYYYDYTYNSNERDYKDVLFFGGPGCSFKFGYKWVFFNVESLVLIGNSVGHLLKTGFSVFF